MVEFRGTPEPGRNGGSGRGSLSGNAISHDFPGSPQRQAYGGGSIGYLPSQKEAAAGSPNMMQRNHAHTMSLDDQMMQEDHSLGIARRNASIQDASPNARLENLAPMSIIHNQEDQRNKNNASRSSIGKYGNASGGAANILGSMQ